MAYQTFDNDIPQPGDLISDSQGDILANFLSLSQAVPFMSFQTPSTPSDPNSFIYTANNSASHPAPFFLNSLGSVPILPDIITTLTGGGSGSGGGVTNYGFKIGPLIFNVGSGNFGGASTTLAIPYPATSQYTTTLSVQVTGINSTPANLIPYSADAVGNTGFNAHRMNGAFGVSFYYISIGK